MPLLYLLHVNLQSFFIFTAEGDKTVCFSKNSVIPSQTDIEAGVELSSPLPYNNIAGFYKFAAKFFYSEAF